MRNRSICPESSERDIERIAKIGPTFPDTLRIYAREEGKERGMFGSKGGDESGFPGEYH